MYQRRRSSFLVASFYVSMCLLAFILLFILTPLLNKKTYIETVQLIERPGLTHSIIIGASIVNSLSAIPKNVCPLQYEDLIEPNRLNSISNDVELLYKHFIDSGIVVDDMFTRINPDAEYKERILKRFEEMIQSKSSRNYIVAFTGHGAKNGDWYISGSQFIRYQEIADVWKKWYLPGKTLTLIIGSCYSGKWIDDWSFDLEIENVFIQTCGTGDQHCWARSDGNGGFIQYWIDFQKNQVNSRVWVSPRQTIAKNTYLDGIKTGDSKIVFFV